MAKLITETQLSRELASDPLYHRPDVMSVCISRLRVPTQCYPTTMAEDLSIFIFEKLKHKLLIPEEGLLPSDSILLFFVENNLPIPAFISSSFGTSTNKLVQSNNAEFDYYFDEACHGKNAKKFMDIEIKSIDKLILRTYVVSKYLYSQKEGHKKEPTAEMVMDELHHHDSEGILCSTSKPIEWMDRKGVKSECSIHHIRRVLTKVRAIEN